jgi:hypothetical protein
MTTGPLPSAAKSLLVPVHLDVWVVDSADQYDVVAWYYAEYGNLEQFASPFPQPFDDAALPGQKNGLRPAKGIHLHWALPDALTRGRAPAGGEIDFPHVPNRWLVLRTGLDTGGQSECKMWVVQSDFLEAPVGTSAADLSGTGIKIVSLAAGSPEPIAENAALRIAARDDDANIAIVRTSSPVNVGDTQINIQPRGFDPAVPAGSAVTLMGTSPFLHPDQPSSMQVTPGGTNFEINHAGVGRSHTIEAWEARAGTQDRPFLQAVGPGNVSFAAHVPSIRDVFSFTDSDLPAANPQKPFAYTYMVVGWYSDSDAADPLRGVSTYLPDVWKKSDDWKLQSPAKRFETLLTSLKWTVNGEVGNDPPVTSMYHGSVASVPWPRGDAVKPVIDRDKIQVAVGANGIDALAALVQVHAQIEAKENPSDAKAWLDAGDTLAELMQAAMGDLLNDYGRPGGAALIREKIHQSWYGSHPGGTHWEVVSDVPTVRGEALDRPPLTSGQADALARQLGALNRRQRDLDQKQRELESLQGELHLTWLKMGIADIYGPELGFAPDTTPKWSDLKGFLQQKIYPDLFNQVWDKLCDVRAARAALPPPTDDEKDDAANTWAKANWEFPAAEEGSKRNVKLDDLHLRLKATTLPRFWHPSDPVILIAGAQRAQKHGEDGRYNDDGTLTCRLPGQTITGLKIPDQPPIDAKDLLDKGLLYGPRGRYGRIPDIAVLVGELLLINPDNAGAIAQAVGGSADKIAQGIGELLQQTQTQSAWVGTAPAPFAVRPWEQAWAPLFLEWQLTYFPTGKGSKAARRFSLDDWTFDGENYRWNKTGFDLNDSVVYQGRTLPTPQVAHLLQKKIATYLKNHAAIDSAQLEDLLSVLSSMDVLSQSLSGLTGQLLTLLTQETLRPADDAQAPACPRPQSGESPPGIAALIGDQYNGMPMLLGSNKNVDYFFPIQGGLIQLQKVHIVDAFGQVVSASEDNTVDGFQPFISRALALDQPPGDAPKGAALLPPRLVQSARLDLKFLVNDESGEDAAFSDTPNAVCGWLLPNHLDGGIAVYDADGIALGELLALEPPDNWRPRAGSSQNLPPPPKTPAEIANKALRNVVGSIAGQSRDVFDDVLSVVDETLWMIDPLGDRKDQFLSVLIGRPLAVVQASVRLSLLGDAAHSQLWNDMATPTKPYSWRRDPGAIANVAFPVRLGSLDLRGDGLIGYLLDDYAKLYTVHRPDEITAGDRYIRQIVRPDGDYQGDIFLKAQGDSIHLTMIVDPRGSVHAYTGILPVLEAALPAHLVEAFMRQLQVTFQTGPIVADPGTLRIPRPAEQQGNWRWVQRAPAAVGWQEGPIVDGTDRARFPSAPPELREGWLQLSDVSDAD